MYEVLLGDWVLFSQMQCAFGSKAWLRISLFESWESTDTTKRKSEYLRVISFQRELIRLQKTNSLENPQKGENAEVQLPELASFANFFVLTFFTNLMDRKRLFVRVSEFL